MSLGVRGWEGGGERSEREERERERVEGVRVESKSGREMMKICTCTYILQTSNYRGINKKFFTIIFLGVLIEL